MTSRRVVLEGFVPDSPPATGYCSAVSRVFFTAVWWSDGAILSGSGRPKIARQLRVTWQT